MKTISSKCIITLGPYYQIPQGGIAQVLNCYSTSIYTNFKHIPTNGGSNILSKIGVFITSIFKLVFSLLCDKNIEALHIHSASGTDFIRNTIYIRLGFLFGKKIILHMHGGGFKEYYFNNTRFVKSNLNKVNCIITLSNYWKSFFTEQLKYQNVYIVHNIIPKAQRSEKKDYNIFNLLYLGHIYPKKGIFDLVTLLLKYRKEYVGKLRLHIGGGLFDEDILRKIIKENNLEDIITFHGWVSGVSKIELLNNANAYILPSYAEGVPISILEAMSYNLPIISTRVGGIPSIVNEKNGFLIEPGNIQEMKWAIDQLLQSKSLQKKLGDKSYEYSLSYQAENVIKELEAIYNKLEINIQ